MSTTTPKSLNKKHVTAIAIGAGILLVGGVFMLLKYFRAAQAQKVLSNNPDSSKNSVAAKPIQATTSSVFPLKNGSPKSNLVTQLQTLLGVTADGLFGPKTAAALALKAGKTQITNQADYDATIAKLQNSAALAANSARADDLITRWNANTALQLTTNGKITLTGYVEDAYGAMNPNGKDVVLGANYKLNRTDYTPIGSSTQGYLKISINNGTYKGTYKVDPAKITLS